MMNIDRTDLSPPRKTWLYASLAFVLGLVGALLFLEFAFRFLPVRGALETQPVNTQNPYLHFKPNNDVVFSKGWNFAIVNRAHVNNYGFVNDQDYDAKARNLLLAVVGDSYVEAAQVPYRDTVQGRLAAIIGARGRVYSFASSGSALSQYLAYAEFARDQFRPNALAVVIVGNDFDESLLEYKSDPGFHYLNRTTAGSYSLELVPFDPPLLHRVLRKSALARYIHGNGFLEVALRRIRSVLSGEDSEFVGNVAAKVDTERLRRSQQAVDYFLAMLPRYSGLAPDRIALLVDGERPHLYDVERLKEAEKSYYSKMRNYLIARGQASAYKVVDLQPRFVARHERDGIRFEWGIDSHWNGFGHEEAASAVLDTGLLQGEFGLDTISESRAGLRR